MGAKKGFERREAFIIPDRPMNRDANNEEGKPDEPHPAETDFNLVFAQELGKHPEDWLKGMKQIKLINHTGLRERCLAAAPEIERLASMLDTPETVLAALCVQWDKTARLVLNLRRESRYIGFAQQMTQAIITRFGPESWRIRRFLLRAYAIIPENQLLEARLAISALIVANLKTANDRQQWGDIDKARQTECLLALGRQEEALKCAEQAWADALTDKDSPRAYRCATLAGDIAMRLADFPRAADYFQHLLKRLQTKSQTDIEAIADLKAKLGEVRVN